jgi:choline dehydrogenase-like flavoprotein
MKVTIIGSGPAAAAASLALLATSRCEVEILDIGERLEPERADLLSGVAGSRPETWPTETRNELSRQPDSAVKGELPEKWMFGSDFPFRDAGQLAQLSVPPGGNTHAVSGAFGGLSNAWGAQVMPFSRATFDDWPVGYEAMVPHYRAILEHIPFAGVVDDYSEHFPLLAPADPLPRLAPPLARLLHRYSARRTAIRRRGVTAGEARLAMSAPPCIECGLCLTGCPYRLVYSASHTLTPLVERRQVRYEAGLLALKVGEDADGCWIETRDLASGAITRRHADRVLLACGGLGTTRVAVNSIRPAATELTLQESVQLVLPFVSLRSFPDPRTYTTFTLNQVNLLIEYGRPGLDLAQVHLYPYNPTFEDALPAVVGRLRSSRAAILRRVVAGLGYLPSWASPSIAVRVGRSHPDTLPSFALGSRPNPNMARALRAMMTRLVATAPLLDLWPIVPALRVSGPAKSYHFAASLPHVSGRPVAGGFETDDLGRPAEWTRIHLIDGSVLPSVAATTFTLTVMANAHRIATAVAEGR